MKTAKVNRKGRITIPKQVRRLLAIEAGDRLAFELEDDGRLPRQPGRRRGALAPGPALGVRRGSPGRR